MELLEQHRRAMAEFDRRVRAVAPDQWHRDTPCEGWDVRALVNHVVVEQLWVPHYLAGAVPEELRDRDEGDQLGDDPVGAWAEAAAAARAALEAPGVLDRTIRMSTGERRVADHVPLLVVDLAIHAWDLARAVGLDEVLDAGLVEALHREWAPRAGELVATGLFAPPIEVGEDADTQTRLLAIHGRDARR